MNLAMQAMNIQKKMTVLNILILLAKTKHLSDLHDYICEGDFSRIIYYNSF